MAGSKSKVVVVGGGIAGALLAKTLQFDAEVVLVDPKEYFDIPWTNLRSMVEPSFAERTTIKHTDYLTNGRLVVSTAVNVTERDVVTADGHTLPYDYLVVATGHGYSVPRTRKERLDQFQAENKKIKDSNSVLIIGGGPTGVELAGEISVDYPDKKVTLVHKGSRLLEFIGPKASKKALNWLTKKKVEVILDQTVDVKDVSDTERVFRTSRGETVSADAHFTCIGQPVGSAWLHDTILKGCLDKNGRLTVDEHLKVKGQSNIFAIGDITDIPELKQGYLAQQHALLVAKNLKVLMGIGKKKALLSYKPAGAMAIVSLGRKTAVAQFPFATMLGCLPGMIKSGDLFVGNTRKMMGLKPKGP